jgi:hypothetical protein
LMFAAGGGQSSDGEGGSESSGSDTDSEDDGEEDEHSQHPPSLPPCPADFPSQINLLRDMDADAEAALDANQAYQAQLLEVMARLDRARKRTGELKVRFSVLLFLRSRKRADWRERNP